MYRTLLEKTKWEERLRPLLGVLDSWMERCIVPVRGHHHHKAGQGADSKHFVLDLF
jgi:hypothetical protein